jgi:hypothetical protein
MMLLKDFSETVKDARPASQLVKGEIEIEVAQYRPFFFCCFLLRCFAVGLLESFLDLGADERDQVLLFSSQEATNILTFRKVLCCRHRPVGM